MNNNTPKSHEQMQWILEQNDIDRQEVLIEAINALTKSNHALAQSNYEIAQSNYEQTVALNTLNSKLICEFTGWNLTEALVNITQTIKQQNKI